MKITSKAIGWILLVLFVIVPFIPVVLMGHEAFGPTIDSPMEVWRLLVTVLGIAFIIYFIWGLITGEIEFTIKL